MIELRNVTKTYPVGGGLTVLRDVSLQIRPRDYLGILGPSGSGKSSLLYLLGLLDRPSSGRMTFLDKDVATLSDKALSELRGRSIGFVFQAFHLVGHLTVMENVELPLFYQRESPGARHRRAKEALTKVHLEHRLGHHPAQLSGGECQRVAIARALVTQPSLILADEPTGNLDSATGRDILAMFDVLHEAGATIVVITHDPSVAARIPRIVHIQDGCMHEENTAP